MAKNILNNNVVHYVKDMMWAWHKRNLPMVDISGLFKASRLLRDEPHPSASRSCQKNRICLSS